MLAVRGDEEEVAALLLQHGADVTHSDFNGHNVVINAAANNQVGNIPKCERKVEHLSICACPGRVIMVVYLYSGGDDPIHAGPKRRG